VQQRDEIYEFPRESKLNAGGFSINTWLQPGAKDEPSRSRFNGFSGGKLLKQFSSLIAAYTGLKPGVNATVGCC